MSFERKILPANPESAAPARAAAAVATTVPGLAPQSRRGGPGRLIARLVERWVAAEARRRDAELLRAMPDYILRDIGLTRDDVRGEAAIRALLVDSEPRGVRSNERRA